MSKGWATTESDRVPRRQAGVAVRGRSSPRLLLQLAIQIVPLVIPQLVAWGQEMSPPESIPASGLTGVPSGRNCDTLLCRRLIGAVGRGEAEVADPDVAVGVAADAQNPAPLSPPPL